MSTPINDKRASTESITTAALMTASAKRMRTPIKANSTNLCDKFKITIRSSPDKVNILGVDLGDGEYCVARGYKDGNKIKIDDLDVDNTGNHKKDFAVYYKNELIDAVGQLAIDLKKKTSSSSSGEFYVRFKKPPCTEYIDQKYGGSFESSALTYYEIMQLNFSRIINDIFKNNRDLSNQKETVLFVGRPSSQQDTGWAAHEVEYQKLLKSGLKVENYNGNIEIIVLSEAQAALAYEISKGTINDDETVLIFDGGSSTFDAVLITSRKVKGEYSRQFGAGKIEENMLEQYLEQRDSEIKEESLETLKLRTYKENYFGTNGNNGTVSYAEENFESHSVRFGSGDKVLLEIDNEMMYKAIYKTPIHVYSSDVASNDPYFTERDYSSFYDAFRDFVSGTKHLLLDKHNVKLDKIIMTGGATVMPFISEVIEKLLRKKPVRTGFPNYSVSEGLAYIGYVEFEKREELAKIKAEVSEKINGLKTSELDSGIKRCIDDVLWNRIIAYLEAWANSGTDSSMEEWWNSFDKSIKPSYIRTAVQKWFNDKAIQEIKELVQQHFSTLLKNAGDSYSFNVDDRLIGQALEKLGDMKLNMTAYKLRGFWKGLLGAEWNEKLTSEKRHSVYIDIIKRKSNIIEKINDQISNSRTETAEKLRGLISDALAPHLEMYVEEITPYFIKDGG
jgi:hypothetical protein